MEQVTTDRGEGFSRPVRGSHLAGLKEIEPLLA